MGLTYKACQIKNSSQNNYQTKNVVLTAVRTDDPYDMNMNYYDIAFKSETGSFLSNEVYYMALKMKKAPNNLYIQDNVQYGKLDISILIGNNEEENPNLPVLIGDNALVLGSFSIPSGTKNKEDYGNLDDNDYYHFDMIFSPSRNSEFLVLRILKKGFDVVNNTYRTWLINGLSSNENYYGIGYYINEGASDNYGGAIASSLEEQDAYRFYTLNNILPSVAKKIGFQSRPGTLIAVNGEPIRVGRSGIFEVYNGIKITSVMVAPNQDGLIDLFLLDYIQIIPENN